MELVIIFLRFFLQLSPWFSQMNLILFVPSKFAIYRWYGEFSRGRTSLQNEFSEHRPKLVVILKPIDADAIFAMFSNPKI